MQPLAHDAQRHEPSARSAGADPRESSAKSSSGNPHTTGRAKSSGASSPRALPAPAGDSAPPSPKGVGASDRTPPAGDQTTPPGKSSTEGEGNPERRLAKIFGAMRPQEAARVLEQMDDSDVKTILNYLGDRQAAAILGSFRPERAAGISRLTMRSARSSQ